MSNLVLWKFKKSESVGLTPVALGTGRVCFLLCSVIVISLAMISCSAEPGAKKPPRAINGVIDLSHWDFEKITHSN